MNIDPTPEHEWLMQLIGAWTYENVCDGGPGEPEIRSTGSEVVSKFGDLWVQGLMEGEMPGCGMMQAIMTLGFDPAKGKFIGTWIGSIMASMFVYEGELDAARRTLTLDTTGPSFTDPAQMANYQDIVTLRDDGARELRSQFQQDDGSWCEFMRAVYTRA